MKAPVNVAEAVAGDVRVNLRGADGRVPEQFLDDPQIGAVLEQMGGKAVPQHVRRDVALDAGEGTVSRWMARSHRDGLTGLLAYPVPGRPRSSNQNKLG